MATIKGLSSNSQSDVKILCFVLSDSGIQIAVHIIFLLHGGTHDEGFEFKVTYIIFPIEYRDKITVYSLPSYYNYVIAPLARNNLTSYSRVHSVYTYRIQWYIIFSCISYTVMPRRCMCMSPD